MWAPVGRWARGRTDYAASFELYEEKLEDERARRMSRRERVVGLAVFGGLILVGIVGKLLTAG